MPLFAFLLRKNFLSRGGPVILSTLAFYHAIVELPTIINPKQFRMLMSQFLSIGFESEVNHGSQKFVLVTLNTSGVYQNGPEIYLIFEHQYPIFFFSITKCSNILGPILIDILFFFYFRFSIWFSLDSTQKVLNICSDTKKPS